jgi:hypothetical protein
LRELRVRVKDPFLHEQTAYRNGVGTVDLQKMDGRASSVSPRNDSGSVPDEVFVPLLPSWVKQRGDSARLRVNSRKTILAALARPGANGFVNRLVHLKS